MTQILFRFHHRDFFEPSADWLLVNFLECHHTFYIQQRFAGSEINSGFFFSQNAAIAAAEFAHYGRFDLSGDDLEPTNRKSWFADRIWLTAEIELGHLLDLRRHETLLSFLLSRLPDNSSLKCDLRRTRSSLDVMLLVLPAEEGGGFLTDWIGNRAHEDGFAGILFPSIRCLSENNQSFLRRFDERPVPFRFSIEDVRKTRINDEMDTAEYVLLQLASEYNVVLFSGSQTIRSIRQLSWILDGRSFGPVSNPLFGADAAEVEKARLSLARSRGLTWEQALHAGLVTDTEIMIEYRHRGFFYFDRHDECGLV